MRLGRRELLLGASAGACICRGVVGTPASAAGVPAYQARGVGGGGAFLGFSMSPYQPLMFVGTDMQTLFRSTDAGHSWQAVPQQNAVFLLATGGQDYADLPAPGYSATPDVVFHAPATGSAIVSRDGGQTWAATGAGSATRRVRYWLGDSAMPGHVLAGTDDGLDVTFDDGATWTSIGVGLGRARGSFLDTDGVLYTGFADGIYTCAAGGQTFSLLQPATVLHRFAGGRGPSGVRLAYVQEPASGGAVFTGTPGGGMAPALVSTTGGTVALAGAEHVAMAENDDVIYVAGARTLANQLGTSIWKAIAAAPFELVFRQADQGFGRVPWPTLQPSAVGLDIGYWDSGYFTFAVNQRNSAMLGGGELFFLHMSKDGGKTWLSPFTCPTGAAIPGQTWTSTGLEDCSIRRLRFSAVAPAFGFACGNDYSNLVTEDGGRSWRVATDIGPSGRARLPHQAVLDVSFDPVSPNALVAAMSDLHDFQNWGNYGRILPSSSGGPGGGIYATADRGRSWARLGPATPQARMPFTSVARNPRNGMLFAGSQGNGVACMDGAGGGWTWINAGIADPHAIVAQLVADAATGDMYALVGGDPTDPPAAWQWTGIYRLRWGARTWSHLRGRIVPPYVGADQAALLAYPTSFALIRGARGAVTGLLLTDAERNGQYLATGLWRGDPNGLNWTRVQQYTFAANVDIDPGNPRRVYLSGLQQPGWGQGGAMFSTDGGQTFHTNLAYPLQNAVWSVTPDPSDPTQVFYTAFGGGISHGPAPKPPA